MPIAYEYGPDSFGALTIPLGAKDPQQPAGDPALFYIVDFLKAWLSTDGNAVEQWQVAGVAPAVPPVVTTIVGSPEDEGYSFDVKQLPALFIFREGGKTEWWGEDWGVDRTTVKLLWVLPIGLPQAQRSRLPFYNAMAKCVLDAIEIGRTPSWTQPGDTDPQAATQGSLFYTFAGFVHLRHTEWKPAKLRARAASGRNVTEHPALEITLEMVERLTFGITNRALLNQSGSARIAVQDEATGNTIVQGQTQGAPTIKSVSPTSGTASGATSVTITGSLFLSGPQVMFGANPATSIVWVSSTSIVCQSPAGVSGQKVDVVVTNRDGQSATLTQGFLYTT